MNVAIIPARGGSKRIPQKNIKPFCGQPIISYSIKAARLSNLFDRIIVSTDSQAIADTAEKYCAEVPFTRPKELSDDFTPTAPVIVHAIEWLTKNSVKPDYVCCIYPTAPFLQANYLKQGYATLCENQVSAVFSVTTFAFTIFRALKLGKDGYLEMFWPEYELTRSNDLPDAYHDAGQFYWLNCDSFMKNQKLYGKDALPVVIPRFLVQDIDTLEDWQTAERMFRSLLVEQSNRKTRRE